MLSKNDDMCAFTAAIAPPIEPDLSITNTTFAAEGNGSLGLNKLLVITSEPYSDASVLAEIFIARSVPDAAFTL